MAAKLQQIQEGWGIGEREELKKNSEPSSTDSAAKTATCSAGCWQGKAFKGEGTCTKQSSFFLILSFPVLGLNSILGSPLSRFPQRLCMSFPWPCHSLHLLLLVPTPWRVLVIPELRAYHKGQRPVAGLCFALLA